MSRRWGNWILDAYAAVWFFAENPEFFSRNQTYREVAAEVRIRLRTALEAGVAADASAVRLWIDGQADVAELVAWDPRVVAAVEAQLAVAHKTAGDPAALRAQSATLVDARSDVYAVGGVAYALVTGGPVFAGSSRIEIIGHHLHSAPVRPSERLGRAVDARLEAMMRAAFEPAAGGGVAPRRLAGRSEDWARHFSLSAALEVRDIEARLEGCAGLQP